MNVILTVDTTGPDPCTHEVFQIGALFTDATFNSEESRFGQILCPEKPEIARPEFLKRAGIGIGKKSPSQELAERMPYWDNHNTVWRKFFESLARHAGGPQHSLNVALRTTVFCCYDAADTLPFLSRQLDRIGLWTPLQSRSLVSSFLDKATVLSYLGTTWDAPKTFDDALSYSGVRCTRPHDASARADAIRECFRRHLSKTSTVYAAAQPAAVRKSGRSRSSGSAPITRSKTGGVRGTLEAPNQPYPGPGPTT